MASEPTLAFPPKGALRRVAFPKLVREIARGKVTGSLYLLNGQTKKVVFFEDGQPVFVRSNVLAECLGQVLSGEGLITQEQCEQTLEAIRRTGKKQGELLVEMGILSEGNLRYGLAAQLRTKLYDIFAWDDGRYQFKPDTPGNHAGVRLNARPEAVIIGAILDRYDEARARTLLDPWMPRHLVYGEDAPLDVEELDLLPEERYFVECIDGSRTVAACVADEVAQGVPNPYALVYGLVQAGVAELSDHALESRPRPARPDFDARPSDEQLRPATPHQNAVTEYEDTPLPGELPQSRALLGDHEDEFADVEALQTGTGITPYPGDESGAPVATTPQISEELIAAEPDQVEETFDDEELRAEDSGPRPSATGEAAPDTDNEELDGQVDPLAGLDLDDLDDLDADPEPPALVSIDEDPDPEPPELVSVAEEPDPEAPALTEHLEDEEELELEEIEELDIGIEEDDDDDPAEPPLEDLVALAEAHDPAATRADPMPPIAVNRDLGGATPLRSDSEPPLGFDPDSDTLGDDLLGGAEDAVDPEGETPVDDLPPLDPDAPLDDIGQDDPLDDIDIDDDLLLGDAEEDDDLLPVSDLDDIDLGVDDEGEFVADDDLALGNEAPLDSEAPMDGQDDLVGLDDLDDVDLALDDSAPAEYQGSEATFQEDQDPEMIGAMRFNEAETALAAQQYPDAVAMLESAYEHGFDVAELHAMLAFARFMAAGKDLETAQHAFELLDYAESMDPSLDLVSAYRGSIHHALGDDARARDALRRALELNPYCELAINVMDQLG